MTDNKIKGCKYCLEDKTIFAKEFINDLSWGWGTDDDLKINYTEATKNMDEYGVFIDRGYLRFVLLDDCSCLDHGKKIEIKFCPFCGTNLQKEEKDD